MISVPDGTGDIAVAMISASQMIYASRMKERILYHTCVASISCGASRISYRTGDTSLKIAAFYDIMKPKGVIRLKIHGVKREWSRPFWVRFKKHYCPTCMNLLTTTKVSKIVNSNSEEAKDYDFSSGDTYMIGNIKFIWTEFLCDACGKTYSLQEIRENEKKTK